MEKLIEEILKDDRFREILMAVMAEKVSAEYYFTDSEGNLIKREIREFVRDEAKKIIHEVVEEYLEMKPIKRMNIEICLPSIQLRFGLLVFKSLITSNNNRILSQMV